MKIMMTWKIVLMTISEEQEGNQLLGLLFKAQYLNCVVWVVIDLKDLAWQQVVVIM